MSQVMFNIRPLKKYRMGVKEINMVFYAEDALLIAEIEDDLQRLLHALNRTAKTFNVRISASKTKCMTCSKPPIRCSNSNYELSGAGEQEERTKQQKSPE